MTARSRVGLRESLRSDQTLVPLIQDGMKAIPRHDAKLLDDAARRLVRQSLDLDTALAGRFPTEHRWDYLVSTTRAILGIEPHQAKGSEVKVVIQKKQNAERYLRRKFDAGCQVQAWFWVTRGEVALAKQESAFRRLTAAGIEFVGRRVTVRHLSR